MPAARPSANPFRNRRMGAAAQAGMLIIVRCPTCRRTVNYWAADLVKVLGPDHEVHIPPFPCSRCRTREVDVRWTVPTVSALEGLTVRRPVRQVVRWLWRDEKA